MKKIIYYYKAYRFCILNHLGIITSGPVFVTTNYGLPISYNKALELIRLMKK